MRSGLQEAKDREEIAVRYWLLCTCKPIPRPNKRLRLSGAESDEIMATNSCCAQAGLIFEGLCDFPTVAEAWAASDLKFEPPPFGDLSIGRFCASCPCAGWRNGLDCCGNEHSTEQLPLHLSRD